MPPSPSRRSIVYRPIRAGRPCLVVGGRPSVDPLPPCLSDTRTAMITPTTRWSPAGRARAQRFYRLTPDGEEAGSAGRIPLGATRPRDRPRHETGLEARKPRPDTIIMMTRQPLRLWPGLLVAALVALLRFVVPLVAPDASIIGLFAGLIGLVLVVLWWMFFSRAAWSERIGAIVLMVMAVLLTKLIVDKSISTGMMGMMFYAYAAPP